MNPEYVCWSFKHKLWWRANRQGYTPNLAEAGRYSSQEAGEIVTDSVMGETVCLWLPLAERRGAPTVSGLWQEVGCD